MHIIGTHRQVKLGSKTLLLSPTTYVLHKVQMTENVLR